jgi:hypothetical protein
MNVDRLGEHCVVVKKRMRTLVAGGAGMRRLVLDWGMVRQGRGGRRWIDLRATRRTSMWYLLGMDDCIVVEIGKGISGSDDRSNEG